MLLRTDIKTNPSGSVDYSFAYDSLEEAEKQFKELHAQYQERAVKLRLIEDSEGKYYVQYGISHAL